MLRKRRQPPPLSFYNFRLGSLQSKFNQFENLVERGLNFFNPCTGFGTSPWSIGSSPNPCPPMVPFKKLLLETINPGLEGIAPAHELGSHLAGKRIGLCRLLLESGEQDSKWLNYIFGVPISWLILPLNLVFHLIVGFS
ncbi:hypothetical protein L2E82_36132 [Cichorium intybus]|uniref:Uncharacterized protein n=1 Tax=Cichorium intybus TaxID=13427 RepID=A0ACB9BQW2_CICIN|nr:hypothetical protein L2E82_36132 [Cichorium intybus]